MTAETTFTADIDDLARRLVGARLLVDGVGGLIVETEAYDAGDPASHSFGGPTRRNAAMFGSPGRAYVYRIHGAHWCLNIVGGVAPGAAVLIRALEPTHGIDRMRERRGVEALPSLCSGPGKLCQALAITGDLDGAPVQQAPFELCLSSPPPPLANGPRIGLAKAADRRRRYGWRNSPFLSRPFPRSRPHGP